MKKFLITGGAGFIGSNLVNYIINNTNNNVLVVDKLTYSGNLNSLKNISKNLRYNFYLADINNRKKIKKIFDKFKPDYVMHLAAESHVDRSIYDPYKFIKTNIFGTYTLLEESYKYWIKLSLTKKKIFRFHYISTDEIYGELSIKNKPFTENDPYLPNNPYSATKASGNHLVRSWMKTYGLPTLITNCSNNYGPYHFPEKLIPLTIFNILNGKEIPIYGNGNQIRDWIYVEDHVSALYLVIKKGIVGETYNIGSNNLKKNIEVVKKICKILDKKIKNKPKKISSFKKLIKHISDRPGHDKFYSINTEKINNELGWKPIISFNSGLKKTIEWYLKNFKLWKK